jgi:hypothetical protein
MVKATVSFSPSETFGVAISGFTGHRLLQPKPSTAWFPPWVVGSGMRIFERHRRTNGIIALLSRPGLLTRCMTGSAIAETNTGKTRNWLWRAKFDMASASPDLRIERRNA